MITSKQRNFLSEIEKKEYRHAFVDAVVGTNLAVQIRNLRDAHGWTQEHLANLAGKKQETISQWENPSYGKYTLGSLKELASAFDVGLLVRFVSFSELADWIIDVSPNRLTPASYDQERRSLLINSLPSTGQLTIRASDDQYVMDEGMPPGLNTEEDGDFFGTASTSSSHRSSQGAPTYELVA